MGVLDTTSCFMVDYDILNFSLGDDEIYQTSSSSFQSSNTLGFHPHDHSPSFPDFVEEELEWLSNKDAFPAVELDIFSDHVPSVIFDHHSPVSVLENSSSSSSSNSNNSYNVNVKQNAFTSGTYGSLQAPVNYPVRARSKRRRRTDLQSDNSCMWGNQVKFNNITKQRYMLSIPMTKAKRAASIDRRCQHCGVDKTPQWRAGPTGPKTLCNACGVRYKSGRLLPEYRPANSPTFSADLHSNSHRKVLEMRNKRIME